MRRRSWAISSLVLMGAVLAGDLPAGSQPADSTARVSVHFNGTEANGASFESSISADGTRVAFDSLASNLVAGDANEGFDVFVHDRATGQTERASVDSNGAEANFDSVEPSISADGNTVAFASDATNLVADDTNALAEVFVRPGPREVKKCPQLPCPPKVGWSSLRR